jgi:hypothetical protein
MGLKGNRFPFIKQFLAISLLYGIFASLIHHVHLTNTTNQTHTEQMEHEPNMYGYPG